jgi:hypothetical protein
MRKHLHSTTTGVEELSHSQHGRQPNGDAPLEGLFLVRVEWASYRWHPQKAFLQVRFVVLEPESFVRRSFSGRLYCSERALWRLNWFLRDFGYDMELLSQDQMDEKPKRQEFLDKARAS